MSEIQDNGAASGSDRRILIVDDEPQVCSMLARMLETRGYSCTLADSAREAREHLYGESYALVLCDVNMPDESGLELARHVSERHALTATLMISGQDDSELAEQALELGAYGYLLKPFRGNELGIAVANALRRRDLELESDTYRIQLEQRVADRTVALQDAIRRLERTTDRLRLAQGETIERLTQAIERREPFKHGHTDRMSRLCALLARDFGLDVESMRIASSLHDVGKIVVPDSVLLKPGAHTPEEHAEVERHPEAGHELLTGSGSELLELGATIALTHHEHYDGSGYPRGLAGAAIPVEGRIACIADAFDALTSDRAQRPAYPVDEAVAIMTAERGTRFDPTILDVLLASLDEALEVIGRAPSGSTVPSSG